MTGMAADPALEIRKEVQSTAETSEPTGITYNKFVAGIKTFKWGFDG